MAGIPLRLRPGEISVNLEKRPSGLIVLSDPQPKEQSAAESPQRNRGPLEIQDEEMRTLAKKALDDLWAAMKLRYDSPIGDRTRYAAHYQAYDYLGKMLLGDDLPSREVLT